LQDVTFPGRVKEIEEICGKPIPYDVDWVSLADDAEALNFIDNISCHRLNMALRVICQDDMGKEAVREGLSRYEPEDARFALDEFIMESARQSLSCVRVIHGRGRHSHKQQSILKVLIQRWLSARRLGRHVIAYTSARQYDGGDGAVYILLRR